MFHCGNVRNSAHLMQPKIRINNHSSVPEFRFRFSTLSQYDFGYSGYSNVSVGTLYHLEIEITQSLMMVTVDGEVQYNETKDEHNLTQSIACSAGNDDLSPDVVVVSNILILSFESTNEISPEPTSHPSMHPTFKPTSSPTVGDAFCGESEEGESDGEWEYYLHIDNDYTVTFDTCSSYLNLFSMRIYTMNGSNATLYAECIECGSICFEPSKFSLFLAEGTYFMEIDEMHYFTVICDMEMSTTPESASQESPSPTNIPSSDPTSSTISPYPTEQDIVVNVTVGDILSSTSYLSDPFGRLDASSSVLIDDEFGLLDEIDVSCFIWQYQSDDQSTWHSFDVDQDDDISLAITRSGDEYTSTLVVQSIRRLNAGKCVDEKLEANHPFEGGTDYRLRMNFEINTDGYSVSGTSNNFNLTTNSLPSGGVCIVQNIDNLMPLEPYNLFCDFWETENGTDLEYNALIGDVVMSSDGFVDDARELTGIASSGNASITVLVKEVNEYNAITCFPIEATFKSMEEILSDIPTNETSAEVVSNILSTIRNITRSTSLATNPDVTVSIHSVVEHLYESNLTSQREAEQIVHDMMGNILQTSTVVSSVNGSFSNITGNIIITELATVSLLVSNGEIVDVDTTTQLAEEYLPGVFDAVDLFIDVSTPNSSSPSTEIQDALYSIGELSQELIFNLEASLVDVVNVSSVANATTKKIDSINSRTDSLINFATLAASTALALSRIGETFSFQATKSNGTLSKDVTAVKFLSDINAQSTLLLGSTVQSIRVPETFMMEQDGDFVVSFLFSSVDNFIPNTEWNADRTSLVEGVVAANIYESHSYSRRRRLSETVEFETNQCFPYLITMQVSDPSLIDLDLSLDESSAFPSCDFWNTNHSFWDSVGCFVFNITDDTVTCGCTHLTTFRISGDTITLETNILTESPGWYELSLDNLLRHPTVWVTGLSLLVIFGVVCLINPHASIVDTPSILGMTISLCTL